MIHQHRTSAVRRAFTLIEMLVVLLIIGLLAAILFPVLNQARESAYQASCAANLKQIYLAVELYRQDEGGYPGSLAALLGDTDDLADYDNDNTVANTGGKGYFKGGKEALVCADDDTISSLPRSSYGDISVDITAEPGADLGRYVWNYWGYRAKDDTATCSSTDVTECMGTAYPSDPLEISGTNYAGVFSDARYHIDTTDSSSPLDVTKLPRLTNRFAPESTIITHCVYHRLPTSNTIGAYDIYNADGSGQGAKDIILLLDGSTKVLDVTTDSFVNQQAWAKQRF